MNEKYNTDPTDAQEFLRMIDDQVLDDFLEQVYGNSTYQEVELESITVVEARYILQALVQSMAEAQTNGSMVELVIFQRLIDWITDQDEEVNQLYNEAMEQVSQNPIEQMMKSLGFKGGKL